MLGSLVVINSGCLHKLAEKMHRVVDVKSRVVEVKEFPYQPSIGINIARGFVGIKERLFVTHEGGLTRSIFKHSCLI